MSSIPWWCEGVADPGGSAAEVPGCPSGALVDTPPADRALVDAGWEPRFLADAGRAAEAGALYRELGFEVRAEPVPAARLSAFCEGCQVAVCTSYTLLYTRRAG